MFRFRLLSIFSVLALAIALTGCGRHKSCCNPAPPSGYQPCCPPGGPAAPVPPPPGPVAPF